VTKVKKVEQDVEGNKSTIDAFTSKVQSGESATFEATYSTTGASPATIVYAVQPPTGLTFTDTPSGSSGPTADIVVNSSGEYSCTPPSSPSSTWTAKAGNRQLRRENKIFDFYTPSIGSVPEGILPGRRSRRRQGDVVDHDGERFNMQCVDFVAPGWPGRARSAAPSRHPGLCKGGLGRHQFRDQELFSVAGRLVVPAAAGATITTPPTTTTVG